MPWPPARSTAATRPSAMSPIPSARSDAARLPPRSASRVTSASGSIAALPCAACFIEPSNIALRLARSTACSCARNDAAFSGGGGGVSTCDCPAFSSAARIAVHAGSDGSDAVQKSHARTRSRKRCHGGLEAAMARGSARRRAVSERVATGIAAARKEFIGDCRRKVLVAVARTGLLAARQLFVWRKPLRRPPAQIAAGRRPAGGAGGAALAVLMLALLALVHSPAVPTARRDAHAAAVALRARRTGAAPTTAATRTTSRSAWATATWSTAPSARRGGSGTRWRRATGTTCPSTCSRPTAPA